MRDVELYGSSSSSSSSRVSGRARDRQTVREVLWNADVLVVSHSFSSFFNCILNICDLNGGSAGVAPSAPSPARALSVSRSRSRRPLLFSSSFLLPLFTYFSLFRHILFPLLVWRFCLFVCCCPHVWMRHSSLTSSEEFHTRDTPLSPLLHTYTPSSTTHGEFDRFAFSVFSFIYLPDRLSPGLSSIFLLFLACFFSL